MSRQPPSSISQDQRRLEEMEATLSVFKGRTVTPELSDEIASVVNPILERWEQEDMHAFGVGTGDEE
jgi:hypothetical protein